MSRAVEILTLQQFEAAGGLADGYAFEDFSCPLNVEIEKFLREKAVQSMHLGSSVTYLVYDKQTSALLGYFTLMLKPFSIAKSMLSKTKCRMLERLAREDKGSFTAAVYLIAQIGKNFALDERLRIHGDELLKLAFERLYAAKDYVGGKLVLVERDVKSPELLKFYSRWNFQSWNERYDDRDKITYDQMLCVLRRETADEPFQP